MIKIPRRILQQEGVTAREWKQDKRHQARLLERMAREFCFGMAFSPAKGSLTSLRQVIKNIRASLTVKSWGN
jgi:hypothetical protein